MLARVALGRDAGPPEDLLRSAGEEQLTMDAQDAGRKTAPKEVAAHIPGAHLWTAADAGEFPAPVGWTGILVSSDRRAAAHGALVLASRDLDWDLEPLADGRWRVLVPDVQAPAARVEVSAYLAENRRRSRPLPRSAPGAPAGALVYGLVLVAIGLAVEFGMLGPDAAVLGRVDASAIRDGEWWRAATALTLHSGPVHLFANLLFGGLFGWLLAEVLGAGVAWLAILASGVLGNLANVYLRTGEHLSVGASTAIFGALGLLGGFEGLRRGAFGLSARRRWAPLVGALALFALFGAGNGEASAPGAPRTDVAAHLFGFVAGILLAPLCVFAARRWPPANMGVQALAGVAAVVVLGGAWWLALTFGA